LCRESGAWEAEMKNIRHLTAIAVFALALFLGGVGAPCASPSIARRNSLALIPQQATTTTAATTLRLGPQPLEHSQACTPDRPSTAGPTLSSIHLSAVVDAPGRGANTTWARSGVFTDDAISWTATRARGTQQTYRVFRRTDVDWDSVRTAGDRRFIGRTNAEAARAGLAPQLADESFATLHHVGQDARGALVEASTRYHGVGRYGQDALHSQYGRSMPNPNYPIDRARFSVDTREYWQWRVGNR
jgi:hypothetical protein